jgi:hypothetical protein
MKRLYSHTALKMSQRCLKQWSYRYIDRLESVEDKPYLVKGNTLHYYLENHYKGLVTIGWHDEEAEIINRYVKHWEREDESWEIISVEEEYMMEVGGYDVVFKPDLIVRINGEVWIVDHKTTKNIPDETDSYNMTDFQHLLYIEGMKQNGYDVKGFLFNYIRSKPPTQPRLLKNGSGIADVRRLDTDYDTLLAFAEEHGLETHPDVADKLRILQVTPNRFFQRHYLLANPHAVEWAVVDTAEALAILHEAEVVGAYPRHVISGIGGALACKNCDFQSLCFTEMMGMNVDLEVLGYRERERRSE